ncbi:hypothetical protein NP493_8008g00000 [Ridgeia piscesae]|uniref:Uncharacterized protein n=1 Tax=Ridgeia piscesae TaxID=27915 RepID=A0AAD9IPP6_RIDPI|nr:hypothetical protein NP493_8008g00000 [Ridgeia piscesae]
MGVAQLCEMGDVQLGEMGFMVVEGEREMGVLGLFRGGVIFRGCFDKGAGNFNRICNFWVFEVYCV